MESRLIMWYTWDHRILSVTDCPENAMRKETIQELSLEGFGKYGAFGNMINPKTEKLGAEPIEFFRDMVRLDTEIRSR
ncbi:MAG: hypothetical protein ACYTEX_27360 [Planctomycetota bacterium]